MPRFYVNKNAQSTGEHEVHQDGVCPIPPAVQNREALGEFSTCHGALLEARRRYNNVDGCAHCCPACHTR